MIGFVWAQSENGVIGDGDSIPWDNQFYRRFYKFVTTQGDVVHGSKTHETLPNGSLPNRRNIVMTRNKDYKDDSGIVVFSKEEVLDYYKDSEAPLLISGGAQIFKEFLPEVTHLYRTTIHTEIDGDTIMPEIDYSRFESVWKYSGKADENNEYNFTIELFKRKDLLEK